ncbi:hypothetical protein [Clostridium magnum]|uniref:Uncharacterized protein n=1 Tax=Clostridium magnum DSM 2767 TaxID=1121326 RepID=A0A162R4B0_9CLOT|nr:hypothetical protein [Clostridium magnum]KZL89403.1 hypothetical protein CLMAG_53070 [Clostridium magnum DSM 2767]SHI20628.1 hypothetical protein SAMN02745944_03211 [Clostridium magnum DSM 2767]
MIKESELQKQILDKIKTKGFYSLINNLELIDDLLDKRKLDDFMPNLSLDYLLKYKYLESAKLILRDLDSELEFINGEQIKNISLNKDEKLYPDIVLYNQSTEKYIILELKRSNISERQAITELLGYKLEIKNHLPFISDLDIHLVVISTEFNALLKHSVASLILSDIPVLCLRPNLEGDNFKDFEIVEIDSWTNTNYPVLNMEAFSGYTLCLYEHNFDNKLNDDKVFDLITISIDYLKSKANKAGSHGFCVAWKSINKKSLAKFSISIFTVNPYNIFYNSRISSNSNFDNPMTEHIENCINNYQTHSIATSSIFDISGDMIEFLKEELNPEFEFPCNFRGFRNYLYDNGEAVICDSWGEIGEFIRMMYRHPNVKRFIGNKYFGNQNPVTFFRIYDLMTQNFTFSKGFDSCADFFKFGIQVGCILSILSTILSNKRPIPQFENHLYWRMLDLVNTFQEIAITFNDQTGYSNPPHAKFNVKNRKKLIETLNSFIDWFSKEINPKSPAIRMFNYGLRYHIIFDSYTYSKFDREQILFLENELVEEVYPYFCNLLKDMIDGGYISTDSKVVEMLYKIWCDLEMEDFNCNPNQLIRLFIDINREELFSSLKKFDNGYKIELMRLHFYDLLTHAKSFVKTKFEEDIINIIKRFDVKWLMNCIEQSKKNNEKVFINVNDNGTVEIAHSQNETIISFINSLEEDEVLIRQEGFVEILRKEKISDLLD